MAAGVRQRPRRVHSKDVERDEGCCSGHFLSLIPSVPQPWDGAVHSEGGRSINLV